VELTNDRGHLVLRGQLAQPGHALFRRASIVLDHEFDLPPSKDTAARVDILGTHLRTAHNKLPGARIARWRKRGEHTDLD
jgi:hypothetical protein